MGSEMCIRDRLTQIPDESGKIFFDRKSAFSYKVTFALSMNFFGIVERP